MTTAQRTETFPTCQPKERLDPVFWQFLNSHFQNCWSYQ